MKAVIQRVRHACVEVDGRKTGEIGQGLLVLLGVEPGDTEQTARLLARKTAALRIFTDDEDKMNRSVLDIGGGVLAVSQFTLCADVKKGNRPSFTGAAGPEVAEPLYECYCAALAENGVAHVGRGVFGAHMDVSLLNDGPVTILYDSAIWEGKTV